MAPDPAMSFGLLLRRARLARGLTQEQLAERAALSPRVISEIERGGPHIPRKDTVALLADALGLAGEERAAFEASARPSRPRGLAAATLSTPPAGRAPALPLPPTPLLGREHEEAALTHLLLRGHSGVRLLTLTGPAGVGKTRLAVQVAAGLQAQGHFADGVRFVALASIGDAALVAGSIAQTLGVQETGSRPLVESLLTALREQHLLLLLDNFEQVLAAAPLLADLLAGCARLHLLVTSRAALHLRAEQQYALGPLGLPDVAHTQDPARVGQAAAAQLFVQRAQAVKPDFALTPANAAAVAQICVRLEGLPLAIELAAAWSRLLPPAVLLARLTHRLPLLVAGPRDLPERQQTLRATLAWSHDLLTAPEQTLFRRLGVFVGGCTLEAAEAVCSGPVAGPPEALDVLVGLRGLVDQSLLLTEEQAAGAGAEAAAVRFRLLEMVREYALEQLAASGEQAALRQMHAAYYLALAEAAEPHLTGPEQTVWLARLEAEHDNLRAALTWAQEGGERLLGLRLAGTLGRFWELRGYLSEGRGWLEGLLAGAETQQTPAEAAVRAKALGWAGRLALQQGAYARATALHEESLTLYRGLRDSRGIATALNNLGFVALEQDELARARALSEESLALRRELADKSGIAAALNNLGIAAMLQANYTRANAFFEESLALRRELGDTWGIATALNNLGELARVQGEDGQAAALFEQSVALKRELGDKWGLAQSLNNLGFVAGELGDYARAAALHEQSLTLKREVGDAWGIAIALSNLEHLARLQGDSTRAAALHDESQVVWAAYHEQSLALFREVGDKRGIAGSLEGLGAVASGRGDYPRATALLEESLALRCELGDKRGIAVSLGRLGSVACEQGDYPRATALLEESLALFRELGARLDIVGSLRDLEDLARRQGDDARARALLEESVALFRELGDKRGIVESLNGLGDMARRQGDLARARAVHEETLALCRDMGKKPGIVEGLEGLARVASALCGDHALLERSARLFGAAQALREAIGAPVPPRARAEHERALTAVRAALGEAAFAAAWAGGTALSPEQAIAAALEEPHAAIAIHDTPQPGAVL